MKATIDGITYEGTEEEIRRIVENPPHRPPVQINWWTVDYPRPTTPPPSPPPPTEYPIVTWSIM